MMNRERKRCKTLTEFKLQTSAIILQINNQLAAGFINLQQNIPAYGIGTQQESYAGDNVRYYTPLEQVIDLYEKDRCGELKETTMRSYSCFCKQFKQWVQNNCPSIAASVCLFPLESPNRPAISADFSESFKAEYANANF